jgi:hypothetical protein
MCFLKMCQRERGRLWMEGDCHSLTYQLEDLLVIYG